MAPIYHPYVEGAYIHLALGPFLKQPSQPAKHSCEEMPTISNQSVAACCGSVAPPWQIWNAPTWFLSALTFATAALPFSLPVLAKQSKAQLRRALER